MPVSTELTEYIRRAFQAGLSRSDIRTQLQTAGWADSETEDALNAWHDGGPSGPVPRPVRSTAASDAFWYALLFVTFGMVAGNVLVLAYVQLDIWLPDAQDRFTRHGTRSLRWSMAALLVFTPVFFWLDRSDRKSCQADPARLHGTIRKWFSSLAMLIAMITLLGDALYLIYTFLDGQITMRFLAKSATVAALALIVLAYFRADRNQQLRTSAARSAWALSIAAAATVALSFWTIGGPWQGQKEQRDRWRISEVSTLSSDLTYCAELKGGPLPETFDPMICAKNPARMTGYAAKVEYSKLNMNLVRLCTDIEVPHAVTNPRFKVTGNTACLDTVVK